MHEARADGATIRLADLPGVWQLREGRRTVGTLIISVVVVCVGVFVHRIDRVVQIVAGGAFDGWLALGTLVVAPVAALYLGRKKPPRPVWGKSQWVLVRERFFRSPQGLLGLFGVTMLYLLALLAPLLAPIAPDFIPDNPKDLKLLPPLSEGFLLGSDPYARDMLSRLIYGSRISLTIGLLAVAFSASIGLVAGLLAGFFGGLTDGIIMRVVDFLLSIPRLVLLLVVMALFRNDVPGEYRIYMIVIILGATGWMGTSRLVRGEVLSVKERDFVQAGRALGLSRWRLIRKHVAPNCLAPVIVSATLGIGGAILVEAALSFLGLGVPEPTAAWGAMVSDGQDYLTRAWWVTTLPGLAIVCAVTSFNLLGDGMRDALDPRLKDVRRRRQAETAAPGTETAEAGAAGGN